MGIRGDIIFIKLTDLYTGKPITIGRNHIVAIAEDYENCVLCLTGGVEMRIVESYKTVMLTPFSAKTNCSGYIEFTINLTHPEYCILIDIDSIIYVKDTQNEQFKEVVTTGGSFLVKDDGVNAKLEQQAIVIDRRNAND